MSSTTSSSTSEEASFDLGEKAHLWYYVINYQHSSQGRAVYKIPEDTINVSEGWRISNEDYTESVPNQPPINVYTNYQQNIHYVAFIGLFGADGFNSNAKDLTGLCFRSTEFVYLNNLLLACGIRSPRLNFVMSKDISKRFQAGHFGTRQVHHEDIPEDDDFYEAAAEALELIPTNLLHGKLHFILPLIEIFTL
ncbi:hypothetical protein MUCCIDRAFT_111366 [Mucor lusitanicus CBS 277.49]|uniref:Uncharacterized protein n=1 Tax=Mucor lusitanicus CBS 277.49 TaxID=747725 RepID=A0A168K573_MUCCL|nr:hypothetical protein MUCCIDRAFT_111366 [Mucor lusitanicus CBS 277.49]